MPHRGRWEGGGWVAVNTWRRAHARSATSASRLRSSTTDRRAAGLERWAVSRGRLGRRCAFGPYGLWRPKFGAGSRGLERRAQRACPEAAPSSACAGDESPGRGGPSPAADLRGIRGPRGLPPSADGVDLAAHENWRRTEQPAPLQPEHRRPLRLRDQHRAVAAAHGRANLRADHAGGSSAAPAGSWQPHPVADTLSR